MITRTADEYITRFTGSTFHFTTLAQKGAIRN